MGGRGEASENFLAVRKAEELAVRKDEEMNM